MTYSVDRIENGIAVCENESGEQTKFKLYELPQGIKEGDLFNEIDGNFIINSDATAQRKRRLSELQNNLFNK